MHRIQAGRDCHARLSLFQGRGSPSRRGFRDRNNVSVSSNATRTSCRPCRRRDAVVTSAASVCGHDEASRTWCRRAWDCNRSVAPPRSSSIHCQRRRPRFIAAGAAHAHTVVLNVPTPSWYLENATEDPNVVCWVPESFLFRGVKREKKGFMYVVTPGVIVYKGCPRRMENPLPAAAYSGSGFIARSTLGCWMRRE